MTLDQTSRSIPKRVTAIALRVYLALTIGVIVAIILGAAVAEFIRHNCPRLPNAGTGQIYPVSVGYKGGPYWTVYATKTWSTIDIVSNDFLKIYLCITAILFLLVIVSGLIEKARKAVVKG